MLHSKIAFSCHCQVKLATCLSGTEKQRGEKGLSGMCPNCNQVSNLFTAPCVGAMHNHSQNALTAQVKLIQQNKQTKNMAICINKTVSYGLNND